LGRPVNFDDVARGFLGSLDDPVIKDANGRAVRDNFDGTDHSGDTKVLAVLLGLVDRVDHQFPIVTP
jgi:alkyl sulfatase BDS1-like metallo-beta-lactamase superfamily hydrolase